MTPTLLPEAASTGAEPPESEAVRLARAGRWSPDLTCDRHRARVYPQALIERGLADGVGGSDPRTSGLSGLRDRIQALGGQLHVHSPHDAGTIVEARLPIHTARRARRQRPQEP